MNRRNGSISVIYSRVAEMPVQAVSDKSPRERDGKQGVHGRVPKLGERFSLEDVQKPEPAGR